MVAPGCCACGSVEGIVWIIAVANLYGRLLRQHGLRWEARLH